MATEEFDAALTRARDAIDHAVTRLSTAGVPAEALAEYVPPRRALLRTKPATMRAIGQVWRLGSLLLGGDGELYSLGQATRAAERGRPGYQSVSREERREIAAAALRGGFEAGTPVNFDAGPIPLTREGLESDRGDDPIGYCDGEVRVRWRAGAPLAGAAPLADFLAERVDLLIGRVEGDGA